MIEEKGFFPLQLVVFPYESIRLHIFEPRYIQLIDDHKDGLSSFCIPTVIEGKIMPIAASVRVKAVSQIHDDGKMDIIVESQGLCRLLDFQEPLGNRMYAGGETKSLTLQLDADETLRDLFKEKVLMLYDEMATPLKRKFNNQPWTSLDYGHLLGFTLEREYEFLTFPEENERLRYALTYLDELLERIKQMKSIKHEASLNGEYRSYPSPEIE